MKIIFPNLLIFKSQEKTALDEHMSAAAATSDMKTYAFLFIASSSMISSEKMSTSGTDSVVFLVSFLGLRVLTFSHAVLKTQIRPASAATP